MLYTCFYFYGYLISKDWVDDIYECCSGFLSIYSPIKKGILYYSLEDSVDWKLLHLFPKRAIIFLILFDEFVLFRVEDLGDAGSSSIF